MGRKFGMSIHSKSCMKTEPFLLTEKSSFTVNFITLPQSKTNFPGGLMQLSLQLLFEWFKKKLCCIQAYFH